MGFEAGHLLNWIICILWIKNKLIAYTQTKLGKYNIHTVVAGTIQLIKLNLSLCLH